MDKIDTTFGKISIVLLLPMYSIGVFLLYLSEHFNNNKFTLVKETTNIIGYFGKLLCKPSIYMAKKF